MASQSAATPTLIVNCGAGVRGPVTALQLKQAFLRHGSEVQVVECEPGQSLCAHVEKAVARGSSVIVAAGGDGTVGAVASVLAGTDVVLGVLPLGTLNHFAKDVGIPLALDEAVATVLTGRAVCIDVGEVNGRTFVNNSSIGLYPTMVKNREAHQRLGRRKWSAFWRALLTAIGRYPLIRVAIDVDGNRLTRRTPLLFVGNNDYHIHGLKLGTRDRLDAGRLAVYITRDVGRFKLVWFAVRALLGRLREAVDFDSFTAERLTIHAKHDRLRVAADGEVTLLAAPLEYRIRPQALRVLVPAPHTPPHP